ANPVDVFTYPAPADFARRHAAIFSSRVRRHVSMITFVSTRGPHASTTARMSRSTARSLPDFSSPTLMTMSISPAPSRIARVASYAFTSESVAPSGKPTTVHTFTREPRTFSAHSRTHAGFT